MTLYDTEISCNPKFNYMANPECISQVAAYDICYMSEFDNSSFILQPYLENQNKFLFSHYSDSGCSISNVVNHLVHQGDCEFLEEKSLGIYIDGM